MTWTGGRCDVAEFVAWLRRPPHLRDGTVPVLPSVQQPGTESTVNRKLSALTAFYQHAARHGIDRQSVIPESNPFWSPLPA